MKKLIQKLNKNAIIRNAILALCIFIIFMFTLSTLLNVITRHNEYINVPLLEGLSLTEARALATSHSLILEVNDSVHVKGVAGGTIIDQNPQANRGVKAGRHIFLTVNSYNKTMVRVPYVTGYSLRQAKNNLQIAGLGISKLIYKDDIATNNVLEQQYKDSIITKGSNIMAEFGSEVVLVVGKSQNSSHCVIPNVIGLTLAEAKSRLWEVGLNIGGTDFGSDVSNQFINRAKVFAQQPSVGTTQKLGAEVSLQLTMDEEKIKLGREEVQNQLDAIIKKKQESATQSDDLPKNDNKIENI